MPVKNTVIGQKITSEKRQCAKELRKIMTPEETLLWRALRTNKLAGWHFRRQQDTERDAHLVSPGFRILRVTNDEVKHDIDDVLRKILENLKRT